MLGSQEGESVRAHLNRGLQSCYYTPTLAPNMCLWTNVERARCLQAHSLVLLILMRIYVCVHPNGASGTTTDGVEYDSNLKKGKPAEIKPEEVIRGWSEALLLMREGDKWEVTIPSGIPCLCVPCYGVGVLSSTWCRWARCGRSLACVIVVSDLILERGVSRRRRAELAYGDREIRIGSKLIPAGSVLTMEIELVKV